MHFIGITGGVGAGKSAILQYLSEKDGIRVMLADEIAHELMEPGTDCYQKIEETFKEEFFYKKVIRFADVDLKNQLETYNEGIRERNETAR